MEESKIFGAEFMACLDCRDVLIVDEIYDSGKTIDLVTMELKTNQNKLCSFCSFIEQK